VSWTDLHIGSSLLEHQCCTFLVWNTSRFVLPWHACTHQVFVVIANSISQSSIAQTAQRKSIPTTSPIDVCLLAKHALSGKRRPPFCFNICFPSWVEAISVLCIFKFGGARGDVEQTIPCPCNHANNRGMEQARNSNNKQAKLLLPTMCCPPCQYEHRFSSILHILC